MRAVPARRMTHSTMYAIFVTINIKDGYADEFAAASLGDGQGSVRDEENCFRFDILRSPDNPNQFYLYEVYANPRGPRHPPRAAPLRRLAFRRRAHV